MNEREPVKIIAAILKAELGLADGQIMLDDQKWNIPTTNGLYVCISYVSGRAISSENEWVSTPPDPLDPDAPTGMTEIQSVAMNALIQIDAMSANNEARTRKEEIIMALRSLAAEAAMDVYNVQIARMPSDFLNVSSLEETVRLNRYTMTIAVNYLMAKEKPVVDYYTQFQAPEVTVNE